MTQAAAKHTVADELGDFTTTWRVIPISLLAIVIGLISTGVAVVLLRLIALFTNLFFFQRWSTALVSPAGNHLGVFVVLVPVAGALVIGFMARYGSERIRGHGIPEAIESILINGSRVPPRLAVLKPIASAISIGSGGPFGAEGPIIMTGGALGSMIAQFFHLTANERKTLLVAGAAAGMSATFAAPVAAVLLAVELLLFEWKPRSFVPVALASATAGAARGYLLGLGPLFPVPHHSLALSPQALLGCALAGILAGGLSALLTMAVYASEDLFQKLPIHWMWWPAIGGVVVGLGGLIFPQALGIGYDTIGALLQGDVPRNLIIGILLVKSTIWAVSLGSGTSGGVLAPLLMMGGALGGVLAMVLPAEGAGFWPLICTAAILGGTMRSPFTATIFALELTHDMNAMLPLFIAATLAHAFTVLVLKRSILTEKISRRGFHLSREYTVDPLEILFVRDVMQTEILALPEDLPEADQAAFLAETAKRGQELYPVVAADGRLKGATTYRKLTDFLARRVTAESALVTAYPDESLRVVVYRMAETGRTSFPVISDGKSRKLAGIVSLEDLLQARVRHLEEEKRRERVLRVRLPFSTEEHPVVAAQDDDAGPGGGSA
ncbi:MAG TPA: chloride channel protein [Gemmatimonadales bacterium]